MKKQLLVLLMLGAFVGQVQAVEFEFNGKSYELNQLQEKLFRQLAKNPDTTQEDWLEALQRWFPDKKEFAELEGYAKKGVQVSEWKPPVMKVGKLPIVVQNEERLRQEKEAAVKREAQVLQEKEEAIRLAALKPKARPPIVAPKKSAAQKDAEAAAAKSLAEAMAEAELLAEAEELARITKEEQFRAELEVQQRLLAEERLRLAEEESEMLRLLEVQQRLEQLAVLQREAAQAEQLAEDARKIAELRQQQEEAAVRMEADAQLVASVDQGKLAVLQRETAQAEQVAMQEPLVATAALAAIAAIAAIEITPIKAPTIKGVQEAVFAAQGQAAQGQAAQLAAGIVMIPGFEDLLEEYQKILQPTEWSHGCLEYYTSWIATSLAIDYLFGSEDSSGNKRFLGKMTLYSDTISIDFDRTCKMMLELGQISKKNISLNNSEKNSDTKYIAISAIENLNNLFKESLDHQKPEYRMLMTKIYVGNPSLDDLKKMFGNWLNEDDIKRIVKKFSLNEHKDTILKKVKKSQEDNDAREKEFSAFMRRKHLERSDH